MAVLFSIITVTYNAQETIVPTIESVQEQKCGLYEHIIIDGDSCDNTMPLVNAHLDEKMVVLSEPDHGIYDAMNKGISMAKGDYLIFMNAGDRFHSPDTLQHYADAIFKNDYPGIVYGETNIVDKDGEFLGPRHLAAPANLKLSCLKKGMVVCHQSMAVLKQIAPLYNLKYKYSSDYEWLIICLQHSRRNIRLDETVTDYLSDGVSTRNHKESLKERYRIMCTYFGTLPTLMRHVLFAGRYLKRRRKSANKQ